MIIHKCKAIYIHIPKTGGSAVKHAILQALGYTTSFTTDSKRPTKVKKEFSLTGPQKHRQLVQVIKDLPNEQVNQYYKFTFIRNPWDRMVSEFHWRQQIYNDRKPPPVDFKQFIHEIERMQASKTYFFRSHIQTQKSFVVDTAGVVALDDIFRLETITTDIKVVSAKLDLPLQIKRYNTSTHRDYREYYNKETKQVINKLYRDDIETFGYTF